MALASSAALGYAPFYDKVRNMKLKQRILLFILRKSHLWEKGLKALLGDARYQQIKNFFWYLYLR